MAIEIVESTKEDPLDFKNIFMLSLEIKQKLLSNNADMADYTVTIVYRKYAVDTDGDIHYLPKTDMIVIPEYLPKALERAMAGDADLLNALGAIEVAIAKIISEERDINLEIV